MFGGTCGETILGGGRVFVGQGSVTVTVTTFVWPCAIIVCGVTTVVISTDAV